MDNKVMNIIISCDDRLARYIPALQTSLYENHKGIDVCIFLMHTKIPAETIHIIQEFAKEHGNKVVEIVADNDDFDIFGSVDANNIKNNKFPIEAYYYFLAHKYLPTDIERCLYLDVDTVCVGNFYDWYSSDFQDNFFICARCYERFDYYCFNSGVFLINLKKFRTDKIDIEFYTKRCIEFTNDKNKYVNGDEAFIGYAFKEYPDNGFRVVPDEGINFCIRTNPRKMITSESLSGLKIIHYIGSVKQWRYYLDDSFIHMFIGEKTGNWAKFNFSFVSEKLLTILNLFWTNAKKSPFFDEIYTEALAATNEMKKTLSINSASQKTKTLLKAVKLIQSTSRNEVIIPQASFNEYGISCEKSDEYIEYKTIYYIKDQWIVFPLRQMLKKGDIMTLKIRCEYKTKEKIWLFLSDYELKTQHFPQVSSGDYVNAITVNNDGYQFLCLSSNSFKLKDDFIRIYDISAWINKE